MAAAETKELAQCLAFAYFAENPNYEKLSGNKESDHSINFYKLFYSGTAVSNYKTKYLSNSFDLNKVKSEFSVKKTKKTNKDSYHPTAKKVYRVVIKCLEKQVFGSNKLSDYEFLGQEDDFTQTIKDQCMNKLRRAFGVSNIKIDVLSPIDIFCVKKSAKQEILRDFKINIVDADNETIIANHITGDNNEKNYSNLIEKYFKDKRLIPISLKLPGTISTNYFVHKIEPPSKNKTTEDLDPFIKFLSVILDRPDETKKIINDVIDIDFNNFETFRTLAWSFPVNFNYKNLKDPKTKQSYIDYNVRFNFNAWGRSAGWNGIFDKSTKQHKSAGAFVGSIGIPAFETFAKKHSKYKAIMTEVEKIRRRIFVKYYLKLKELNPEVSKDSKYTNALKSIFKKEIIYKKSQKSLKEFFTEYDESLYKEFLEEVINELRGEQKNYMGTPQEKLLEDHFAHAQLSYFLNKSDLNIFIKQSIFLMIFGLITKTNYSIIEIDDYNKMKALVSKEVKKDGKKLISEFSVVPHYLIS